MLANTMLANAISNEYWNHIASLQNILDGCRRARLLLCFLRNRRATQPNPENAGIHWNHIPTPQMVLDGCRSPVLVYNRYLRTVVVSVATEEAAARQRRGARAAREARRVEVLVRHA